MNAWLRRAGRGLLPDGRTLVWSVAEGRRGQRWRSSTLGPEGRLDLALLIEVDGDGWFNRLELTTSRGMLTLHPEPDRSRVDGNVVSEGRVTPISLPWSSEHMLWVRDSPIAEILTGRVEAADGRMRRGLSINSTLEVAQAIRTMEEWTRPPADDRGVPELDASAEWDLES